MKKSWVYTLIFIVLLGLGAIAYNQQRMLKIAELQAQMQAQQLKIAAQEAAKKAEEEANQKSESERQARMDSIKDYYAGLRSVADMRHEMAKDELEWQHKVNQTNIIFNIDPDTGLPRK